MEAFRCLAVRPWELDVIATFIRIKDRLDPASKSDTEKDSLGIVSVLICKALSESGVATWTPNPSPLPP